VVTTRHGGIPEFVDDGASALIVAENDAEALADALIRLLDDASLATQLARHGPLVASRFDVASCSAAVDSLYDEMIARRNRK